MVYSGFLIINIILERLFKFKGKSCIRYLHSNQLTAD